MGSFLNGISWVPQPNGRRRKGKEKAFVYERYGQKHAPVKS
jgi:hypothetical protein